MITPMKAYSYYHGLHLHFGADSYSILKYGANTKQAADKFKKLTPNQKFRFDWLANKFSKTEDLVFAIIGCELNDIDETNHLSTILDSTNFSFVRTKILKLVKYKSFFSPTKYLSILNHEEPVSA